MSKPLVSPYGHNRKSWEEFLPYILPFAQGLPDELAAHYARLAAIELAQKTHLLQHTVHLPLFKGQRTYSIDLDDSYSLLGVRRVFQGCEQYRPIHEDPGKEPCGCWYYIEQPCDILIGPTPCEDDLDPGLQVRLVLQPGQDTCYVDADFYNRYAETIAYGALERALMIDGDWANPQMAGLYRRKFEKGMAKAKNDKMRGGSYDPRSLKIGRRFV